jgi:hypothetical protein
VTTRKHTADASLGRAFADSELLGLRMTFVTAVERNPGLLANWEHFKDMARRTAEDVESKGVGCFPALTVVTGRRPL